MKNKHGFPLPIKGHLVRYTKLDRPVTDPEALPVKLRVTKDMYRKLQGELERLKKENAHHSRKAHRAEYLLRMAIKALTTKTDNAELSREVINLYMEELQNDWALMVMEWTGMKWLDTNFNAEPGQTYHKRDITEKLLKNSKLAGMRAKR